jgi:RimJ/RimL family protein N-acetyltransferase
MDGHPNAATDELHAEGVTDGPTDAPHALRTERFELHRVHPDDVGVERLHALFTAPDDPAGVLAPTSWDPHDDLADTRAYLDGRAADWRDGDHEYVVVVDGEDAGTVVLEVGSDGSGEFGAWLRPAPLVQIAFECLDAPYVTIGCLAHNDQSRRAIEAIVGRFGGSYCGSLPTVPSGADDGRVEAHHEWSVTRERYAAGERGVSSAVPGVAYGDVAF